MTHIKEYTAENCILYQIANWAMLGLVDIVGSTTKNKLYSFLDELFETSAIC